MQKAPHYLTFQLPLVFSKKIIQKKKYELQMRPAVKKQYFSSNRPEIKTQ
jgi:hypothetical protein